MNKVKLLMCVSLLFLTACTTTQSNFTSTGGDGFNVLMSEHLDTITDKNFTRKDKIKSERILSDGTILMNYQFGKKCIIYVNLSAEREVLGKMGEKCGFAFNNDIDIGLKNLIKSYATYNKKKTLETISTYKKLDKELQGIKLTAVKIAPKMIEMNLQKKYLDEYVFGMSKEEYKEEKSKLESLEKGVLLTLSPLMQEEAEVIYKMIKMTNIYHKTVLDEHKRATAEMKATGIKGFIELRNYLIPVHEFMNNLNNNLNKG